MPFPITITYTFAGASSSIPLSQLDADFTQVVNAVNGISSGAEPLSTPNIGNASGSSLTVTGSLRSSGSSGIGYNSGAGGSAIQLTSKATAVTINSICGQITTSNAALGGGAEVTFQVNNSTVAANDLIILNMKSGGTAGSYLFCVSEVGVGYFKITMSNASTGSLSQACVFGFMVLKGVIA